MNSVFCFSSLKLVLPLATRRLSCLHFQSQYRFRLSLFSKSLLPSACPGQFSSLPLHSFKRHLLAASDTDTSNEGAISVMNFEDLTEKDWSFLEPINIDEEYNQKIDRIIAAGGLEETSKALISFGSEVFVDRVVNSSPCKQLLVVHDSLLVLAFIKEKYDKVKCWQGELVHVPQKWAPFDVVFLNFLPALPFQLDQILRTLAAQCLPGARLVISHPQGRELVVEHRRQYPEQVVSDLPDKKTLQDVSDNNSFDVVEFIDEPDFYLSVLKLRMKETE